jgi:dipeptidyl aminopeptidase/acylaminoacyl peptidase
MTTEPFDRRLSAWLDQDAAGRVPDHLAEVLVATRATRQRPAWSSPERWLPVDLTFRPTSFAFGQPLRLAIILGLLLLAAAAAIVFIAAQQNRPVFGLAGNGQILVTDGTTLRAFEQDGTAGTVLAELPGEAASIVVSPDGTRVAYVLDVSGRSLVRVMTLDDGETVDLQSPTFVGGEPMGWSPDGRWLTFAGLDGAEPHIYVAATDGSSLRTVGEDAIDARFAISSPTWSPDGEWLAFVAGTNLDAGGQIHLVRPDGTDLRTLDTPPVVVGDGGWISWAPDPTAQRLLYVALTNGLHIRLVDVATGRDFETALDFWPSWSPDGSRISGCCARIVETADVLAGAPRITRVFEEAEGSCSEFIDRTGFMICSAATWSPDGTKLIAKDVAGGALLIAPVDGSSPPIKLPLGSDSLTWTWQPIR